MIIYGKLKKMETETSNGNNKLYTQWVINCSAGELLGIGIAGGIAVAINSVMSEPYSTGQKINVLFAMLLAGAFEGTSVAWFQWRVLRHVYPTMRFINWWKWTVAIAVFGWTMGMLPSLFFINSTAQPPYEPALWFVAVTAAAGGALAGALFGWAQSFELRKHTDKWMWWIVANTLAWSVAMVIIFMGATWPAAETPAVWIITSAIISGCFAGLSLGIITGWFLVNRIIDKTMMLA